MGKIGRKSKKIKNNYPYILINLKYFIKYLFIKYPKNSKYY